MYSAAVRGRRPPPPLGRLSAARDPCGGLGQRQRPAASWARPGTGDLLCDLSLGFVASRKWVGTAVRVVTVTGVRLHRKPPAPQGSGERRGRTGAPKTRGEPRFKRLPQAPRAPSPLAGGLPGIAHVSPKDGAVPLCLCSFQAAREAGGTRGCPSPSGPGPRARVLLRFQTQLGPQGAPESPTQMRRPGRPPSPPCSCRDALPGPAAGPARSRQRDWAAVRA